MKIRVKNEDVRKILENYFYFAWKVSKVVGMGFLQDRPSATSEDVIKSILREGDNRVYADYVFGRMMKMGIELNKGFTETTLIVKNDKARFDYQSWSKTFSSEKDVLIKALEGQSFFVEAD